MRARLREILGRLAAERTDPRRLGLAVGLGVFVGWLPLYGLHLPICLGLAAVFRLNPAILYLAANISNPLMAPALVASGLALGEWLRFGRWRGVDTAAGRDFLDQLRLWSGQVPDLFLSCLVGSAVLGVLTGLLAGLATWRWATARRATREG